MELGRGLLFSRIADNSADMIIVKNEFIDDLQTKTRPVAVSFSNVVYFERMDNGNIHQKI